MCLDSVAVSADLGTSLLYAAAESPQVGTTAAEAVRSPGPGAGAGLQGKAKLEEDMEEVSMERHGLAKQLVVFFGAAGIGTGGGWGADAVLRACCKVWPPASPHRPHAAARQPAASEPGPSTPPPAKRSKHTEAEQAAEPTQPTMGKAKGKAAKAKPAPQPGRWLDRDCNAALNMQRIGESKWRPLELCYWPEHGYKWDRPPKAQQQQQPVVAQ
ncbi:hypothetical protein QJQ45_002224 [Haematococcus lacustris]|nr:hypothetical protein QJQ45_002224 [Haematococcus lacustris]